MDWKRTLSEIKERGSGRLSDAVNWKAVLVIGIAVSLVLCLYHVYRFMKTMGI